MAKQGKYRFEYTAISESTSPSKPKKVQFDFDSNHDFISKLRDSLKSLKGRFKLSLSNVKNIKQLPYVQNSTFAVLTERNLQDRITSLEVPSGFFKKDELEHINNQLLINQIGSRNSMRSSKIHFNFVLTAFIASVSSLFFFVTTIPGIVASLLVGGIVVGPLYNRFNDWLIQQYFPKKEITVANLKQVQKKLNNRTLTRNQGEMDALIGGKNSQTWTSYFRTNLTKWSVWRHPLASHAGQELAALNPNVCRIKKRA